MTSDCRYRRDRRHGRLLVLTRRQHKRRLPEVRGQRDTERVSAALPRDTHHQRVLPLRLHLRARATLPL